jgi:hypothetical protein
MAPPLVADTVAVDKDNKNNDDDNDESSSSMSSFEVVPGTTDSASDPKKGAAAAVVTTAAAAVVAAATVPSTMKEEGEGLDSSLSWSAAKTNSGASNGASQEQKKAMNSSWKDYDDKDNLSAQELELKASQAREMQQRMIREKLASSRGMMKSSTDQKDDREKVVVGAAVVTTAAAVGTAAAAATNTTSTPQSSPVDPTDVSSPPKQPTGIMKEPKRGISSRNWGWGSKKNKSPSNAAPGVDSDDEDYQGVGSTKQKNKKEDEAKESSRMNAMETGGSFEDEPRNRQQNEMMERPKWPMYFLVFCVGAAMLLVVFAFVTGLA